MYQNFAFAFILGLSLIYGEYTPTFLKSEVISKIDSIRVILETDSVVYREILSEDDGEESIVLEEYSSGYGVEIDEEDYSICYDYLLQNKSIRILCSFNDPENPIPKEEQQYIHVVGDEQGNVVEADWIFRFKKETSYVDVYLNFQPVGELDEGEVGTLDIYIAQGEVELRGVVLNIPYDEPLEKTAFPMELEGGAYNGHLHYDPISAEFEISIDK